MLITRGQRFEGFTPEGERILAWARAVLAAHDGLQAEASLCKGQVVGELRLGMVPLASVDPMIFIRQLTQKYPELTYSLYSMSSQQIADGVSRNQLELGICYLNSIDTRPFDIIQLPKTEMGLLHDIRHFQLDQETLTWQELMAFPLGFLTKGMHYREHMEVSFKSAGINPESVFESDSTFQIIQAVQSGVCCAVMPLNNGLENLNSHFRITPITDSNIEAPIGLIMRRQAPVSSLALRCFTDAQALYLAENNGIE